MSALTGTSSDPNVPGVTGENTAGAGGVGVAGISVAGDGVRATSTGGNGLSARSTTSVAIFAESNFGVGVVGIGHTQPGVAGSSDSSDGVRATSTDGNGLSARSTNSVAIFAESENSVGVVGIGHAQPGVAGSSDSSDGVRATSTNGNGLSARSTNSVAIFAESTNSTGVSALGGGNQGVGIFAQSSARRSRGNNTTAGFFDGDVVVQGDVQLTGGDCAEDFDIAGVQTIDPGTVMVLHEEGALYPCHYAYDKKVTGVVSGAGDLKPGIVLDKRRSTSTRLPIALVGKAYCKVDAGYGSIQIGDLLTTSATLGHAMKAVDNARAFGAVVGKALAPMPSGCGLIPILVTLQ